MRPLMTARRLVPASILALGLGCQELEVTNPNAPDRERARRDPRTVEGFVEGAFRTWWEWTHDDSPVWAMSTMADEFSAAFFDFGILETSKEPRLAWNNSAVFEDRFTTQDPWYGMYGMISTVNDALAAIDNGLVLTSGASNVTKRADAVGKFMQALGYGYLALWFDQGFLINEHVDVDALPRPYTTMYPYTEMRDSAVKFMREAIDIANANTFTLPATGWLYAPLTNLELARLGHSFIARFIAYTPRTRDERDAADWARVIIEVDSGITTNFAPTAVVDILVDDFKRVAARTRGSGASFIPGDFARVDYWMVGWSDSTNRFRDWAAKPVDQRTRFQLITRDTRVHPRGAPSGKGTYLGHSNTNRFTNSRGTYHQSNYYYHRWGEGLTWQTGGQMAVSVAEMQLLKAEALIRLGSATAAIPIINASRLNGGLPAVDINGPPNTPGCVPRQLDGDCGSLWDALRWEKRIETIGIEGDIAFFDARGWQTLVVGTPLQFPVPGRELETMGQPGYTFGGANPFSAPPPQWHRCPVPLPRCE